MVRGYRGLTWAGLGRRSGVKHSHISAIENGKRTGSTQILMALAKALQAPLEVLVGRGVPSAHPLNGDCYENISPIIAPASFARTSRTLTFSALSRSRAEISRVVTIAEMPPRPCSRDRRDAILSIIFCSTFVS